MKKYLKTWFGWLEKQFCKPKIDGRIDCTCNEVKHLKNELQDWSKEHCKFKERPCKKYCEEYCDHFASYGMENSGWLPICPKRNETSDDEEKLLPSDKQIEEYLENFNSGKMCLE